MSRSVSYLIYFVITWLFNIQTLTGQASYVDKHPDRLVQAKELYDKEKYVAAQNLFDQVLSDPTITYQQKTEAAYYSFLCSSQLYHKDTKYKGLNFIAQYPESPYVNLVYFQLGNNEYVNKNYKNAIPYFQMVDKKSLSEDEKAELHFKKGYSWLMLDSLERARIEFYEIKDVDNIYSSAALYYYSYIAFVQKNYATALDGFIRLKEDENFASIVPYYIVQCYFYLGKNDELIAYAVPIIDSVIPSREAEIAYLIGSAFFRKNQYKEAIPYFERFLAKDKKPERSSFYQPAYCYYQVGDYAKAIPLFEKIATENSQLGQNASYHLGYCYLKENAKDKAMLAFSTAAQASFDPNIQEDASFNYAVLTLELANTPFNNAIKALSDYVERYPYSRRKEEAYQYLVTACLNTRNYQDALNYLNKVQNKDAKVRKAYQRASFFRALELFNNLDLENASKYFELAQRYSSSDPVIAARTLYWQAEIQYRNKIYDDALEGYLQFYDLPAARQTPEFVIAPYNIAYCYFNLKKYSLALQWFQRFVEKRSDQIQLMTDSYIRIGDCYFATSKYKEAITYYAQAITKGTTDKDYAMFQRAFATGLLGDHKQKIVLLNELIRTSPNSVYLDDALYEIGQSHLALQNSNEAKNYYRKIIAQHPLSSYVKKAWLQLGLIDYNNNQFDSAIVKYKKVINDYPNTSEARSALNGIKNIYIELNQVDEFLKLSNSFSSTNLGQAEQDSLLYYSAENLYTKRQWNKAIEGYKKYIQSFPKGNFTANAHFYLADCYLRTNMPTEALEHLNVVISLPRNNFTELALVTAAQLNIEKKDFYAAVSNCESLDSIAEVAENRVTARLGKALGYFQLKRYQEAIISAQWLLNTPGIPQETERTARYVLAKSYLTLGEESKAMEQLRRLARDVKNKEGAEAKYLIAENLYKQNQLDKAMKEIFNFIDLNTPHQYWVAKAYILLAQIYFQKNNTFQAIKTLESIINNYDVKDDGIIQEAKELKSQYEDKPKSSNLKNIQNTDLN
ncbi:MAG: tetratricopeptide repeat protein [Bacteroidales bacterium]|nr:tetratricopeptide repeat protein [Bacteroidales bacterium]